MIIDQLAKLPINEIKMGGWVNQLEAVEQYPIVEAKVSGLNTTATPDWSAADLKPYFDFAIEKFGPGRLMFGTA